MKKSGHILTINPGSTSTKLGLYKYDIARDQLEGVESANLVHSETEGEMASQLEMRYSAVEDFLMTTGVEVDIIMARSAPLKPLQGGIYAVNECMLDHLRTCKYSRHASNFAALIGNRLSKKHQIPVYITDPITTDELAPVARISGVPGIERKSRSHALNIKASLRKVCLRTQKKFDASNWVVCHMGGGISVVAVQDGRLIDVNDALLGMGPFSPERAGSLPLSAVLEIVYTSQRERSEVERILSKESGLKGYLATADLQEVEQMIQDGDSQAQLIFQAMVYQIIKEIAAMASTLKFNLDGIILTGGMAHSSRLVNVLKDGLESLAPIHTEAGENELEALAQAAYRVISQEEEIQEYQ